MSRVLAEHWSRLDTLGAARGDAIAVAASMRPADSTSPVRRSASVGTWPSQNCDPIDLLVASRRRSIDSQASQPIAIGAASSAVLSPLDDGCWAQGNMRAFSVPSLTNQLRTSALAAAVEADRQHGRGAAAQQLHQQRPPPAPSAGAGVSRGHPTQSCGAAGTLELQPVLEHGSAHDAQSTPQLLNDGPASAGQPEDECTTAIPAARGSTFAMAGPRVVSAFSEAGSGGHGAEKNTSSTATPFRGAQEHSHSSHDIHQKARPLPLTQNAPLLQATSDSPVLRPRPQWRCILRRQPAAQQSACSPSPSPATAPRPGAVVLPVDHTWRRAEQLCKRGMTTCT